MSQSPNPLWEALWDRGWDSWRASLAPARQARADELVVQLRALGCKEPEFDTVLELEEDWPNLARWSLYRRLWQHIDAYSLNLSWIEAEIAAAEKRQREGIDDPEAAAEKLPRVPSGPGFALKRMLATGASQEDLVQLARWIAAEAIQDFLYLIEEGDQRLPEGSCRWSLSEASPDGTSTGRELVRLFWEFLDGDPSGLRGLPEGR